MKNLIAITITMVFCFVLSSRCLSQVDSKGKQGDSPSPRSSAELPPIGKVDQAVIDDINQIRRQLGGGIGKELEGLNQIIKENPISGGLWTTIDADELDAEFNNELERLVEKPEAASKSYSRNLSSPRSAVQTLRESARMLETIAANLEEVNHYAEADSLRGQARDFWLKARKQNTAASTAARPKWMKPNLQARPKRVGPVDSRPGMTWPR
jgi:hypothetical protein